MLEDFETETKNIKAIPSFPNLFEGVNFSNSTTNDGIVRDLIYGINKEVEWYERFGDNISDYDRMTEFTGALTNRTLARPLFELCFEGDKEDPKDMFLLIKANPLFVAGRKVIGVGGRLYFDGRIDYGQNYPFFNDKLINLVHCDTKLLAVDYYGYKEFDNNLNGYRMNGHIKEEDKANFFKGCELLGIDSKEVYDYENWEENPEGNLLKKIRIYKIDKKCIINEPNIINVLYSNYQHINSIINFMAEKDKEKSNGITTIDSKSFYWDLPFTYVLNPDSDFGALLIERVRFPKDESKKIDYHFQESCFGKKEIVEEVEQFQTYSAFLCNQQERLVEFIKYF